MTSLHRLRRRLRNLTLTSYSTGVVIQRIHDHTMSYSYNIQVIHCSEIKRERERTALPKTASAPNRLAAPYEAVGTSVRGFMFCITAPDSTNESSQTKPSCRPPAAGGVDRWPSALRRVAQACPSWT